MMLYGSGRGYLSGRGDEAVGGGGENAVEC
jgi:hypothetical protein